jgi:hypothetical protein
MLAVHGVCTWGHACESEAVFAYISCMWERGHSFACSHIPMAAYLRCYMPAWRLGGVRVPLSLRAH